MGPSQLRLYLLRHAKSAWPDDVADHERPLARRGREAAPMMGRHMKQQGYQPDLALVSTALRTRETFALVDAELRVPEHRFTRAIYGSSAHGLLSLVEAAPASASSLLLVGHNPGMADLAALLTDEAAGEKSAMQRLAEKYPTAGLAVFDFTADRWSEIAAGQGRLVAFVTPRMLGGVDED